VQLYFYRREREILKLPFVLLLFLAHILKDSEFFNIPHSQFFRRSKLHQELLSKEEQEFWRARIKQLSIDIF
jgi:hypothetical protein